MTNCGNPDLRDVLPDFAAERLSAVESARVQRHVDTCEACTSELALIQLVRTLRPSVAAISVPTVVAALPRPTRSILTARSVRNRSHVWQIAAAIGVIVVGGGSLLVARTGGFESVATMQGDSVGALTENATGTVPIDSTGRTESGRGVTANTVAVSFGNVGDYSDEELDRILERLEQWDGATSTESMSTPPIVPVQNGGTSP